jgi:hypothetical protein
MTLLNVVRPLGRPVSGHPEDQFSGSWPSMTLLEYDWGNMTSVQGLELIGGDIGVLLLQEPTASADLTITWAHSLHEAGMSVSVPMLEKNPVKWQDINSDNLQQWLTISERSLALLKIAAAWSSWLASQWHARSSCAWPNSLEKKFMV